MDALSAPHSTFPLGLTLQPLQPAVTRPGSVGDPGGAGVRQAGPGVGPEQERGSGPAAGFPRHPPRALHCSAAVTG